MIIVSAADCILGRQVVEELLDAGVPADGIAVTVHRPQDAADLSARGVQVRQADYTRKTQELAAQRRAFEAERQGHRRQNAAMRTHLHDAARIVALNDHLTQLDRVDWPRLQAQDAGRAAQLWQQWRPDHPDTGALPRRRHGRRCHRLFHRPAQSR